MTHEEIEELEEKLKDLRALSEIAAESAATLDHYFAIERISASYAFEERIAKVLPKITELQKEIVQIERDFLPPWD